MLPHHIEAMQQSISEPRLRTYVIAANGNTVKALELYKWNVDAATALNATLGFVEVTFRNTIDAQLRKWNQSQGHSEFWIQDPAKPLSHIVRSNPPNWKPSDKQSLHKFWWESKALGYMAVSKRKDAKHDDLVAALTFGVWLRLLPIPVSQGGRKHAPQVSVFNDALNAFENAVNNEKGIRASAGACYYWMSSLRTARNRAAHLEPLLDTAKLLHWHRLACRALLALEPGSEHWITGPARIPKVIKKYPG